MLGKKALFIHSHKFIYGPDCNVYSSGQYPYNTWLRYLSHFESLKVAGRYEKSNNIKNLNLSSGENVTHIKLPNLSNIMKRFKHRKIIKSILKKEIEDIDVVIARLPSDMGLIAINEAKKQNKPYVIELVGDPFVALWNHGSILGKIIAPVSSFKVKKTIEDAPYVLYVTENYLQEKYPSNNLIVTTNCSNVELVEEKKLSGVKCNNVFTIGLIGSYTSKYKGISNALNVIKMLDDAGYEVIFRILGNGDANTILELATKLKIEHLVKIDGILPAGKPVLTWLSNLDLYIQPSLTEGLPRSLIEAMHCSLPCIASNVGGIPELLDQSWTHNPKDEKRMFQLVKKMIEDEENRKIEGVRNREKSLEYTTDNLNKKRTHFWNKVLKHIERKN